MRKRVSAGLSLVIIFLPIWLTIVAFDLIDNLYYNRYPRLSDDTIVIFIVVFVASVAIPLAITIWLIDLRKEEKRFWGLRITLIVISSVISLLFTFGGMLIGFVESYTDNVKNYGKVEQFYQHRWETAESYFPESLNFEELKDVTYTYNSRAVVFDNPFYFDLTCVYEEEDDYMSEKARLESLLGKYLIRTNDGYKYMDKYYDGYVEVDDVEMAIHYYLGMDTHHDLPIKKEKLGIDLW
ncbi:MAG: hypothetical protein E7242_01580 [Lachnospiraceae bacterium]|nr:hypothetical protein [Lachnospiraceae bacterium]